MLTVTSLPVTRGDAQPVSTANATIRAMMCRRVLLSRTICQANRVLVARTVSGGEVLERMRDMVRECALCGNYCIMRPLPDATVNSHDPIRDGDAFNSQACRNRSE